MYDRPTIKSNFEDVGEFHYKFGLPSVTHEKLGVTPREVSDELLEFRLNFLMEELKELVLACGAHFKPEWGYDPENPEGVLENIRVVVPGDNKRDLEQMFDALIDLVYVALGTAHLAGFPWQEGWSAVQKANMKKTRAAKDGSDSVRGSSFDVVKPEGWRAPDIAGILRKYGWQI